MSSTLFVHPSFFLGGGGGSGGADFFGGSDGGRYGVSVWEFGRKEGRPLGRVNSPTGS